jgi:hypothetical protein
MNRARQNQRRTADQETRADQERTTGGQEQGDRIELPSPAQLAQIAAAAGPKDNPDRAIQEAAKLYLRAALFCREHRDDSLETLGRAVGATTPMQRSHEELRKLAKWPDGLPKPAKFPATLKEFFRLVVRARTTTECTARLHDFLREGYLRPLFWRRPNQESYTTAEAEAKACAQIAEIKEADKQGGHFTEDQWQMLGSKYMAWWREQKSEKARGSAMKKKKAA